MREYQRKYKAEHGYYQTRLYDKPRVKQHDITCQHCGKDAVVTKAEAKYCSHRCFYDSRFGDARPRDDHAGSAERKRQPARRRRAERTLQVAVKGTSGSVPWVAGHCLRCGETFVRRDSGTGVSHCSKACQQRDKASRRRALEKGASVGTVSRWRVHVRDHWTCHICGDPVDRDAVVPDLAAPVLDHVMPLARGGTHSEDNLKTAHFYCNSVKRDLVANWSAAA
ncbi:HNH endonuclease [Streptomyces sp. NBC_00086]|uniref:HNH endonuclease n=1 Tax=unclassified Streptomyces TaxID=2593676 RepID=UPI0033905C30